MRPVLLTPNTLSFLIDFLHEPFVLYGQEYPQMEYQVSLLFNRYYGYSQKIASLTSSVDSKTLQDSLSTIPSSFLQIG
jgi:hypothetical protein